jgi:hypothetical protein
MGSRRSISPEGNCGHSFTEVRGIAPMPKNPESQTDLDDTELSLEMDQPLYIACPRGRRQSRSPEAWGRQLHEPLHDSIADIHEAPFIKKVVQVSAASEVPVRLFRTLD